MRNDDMVSRDSFKRTGGGIMTFAGIPTERWEKIFGTPDETRRRMKKAIAEQRRQTPVAASASHLPAIQGDKLYTGFDHGLQCHTRGRSHRREIMRARGVRCAFD